MDPYQNPSTYFIPNPVSTTDSPDLSALISSSNQEAAAAAASQEYRGDRDRFPQWTQAETKELLSVRAELDRSFTETKRNKPLWEAISARMSRKGFVRTPEQCKSKWKNLVTRYKSSEAMEGERQFPYQEEMRNIFAERMERVARGKEKVDYDEEGDIQEIEHEESSRKIKKRKKKVVISKGGGGIMGIEEALREFGRRQMEMEMRWMAAAEEREAERRSKEEEWRREMVALQEERMAMERRWREREEERRAREEARDERRHTIITAILTKIGDKWS